MSKGQASGDNLVHRGVKNQAKVRTGDFEIHIRITGHAISPVNNPVIACVNRSLQYGWRNFASQMAEEIARAMGRVTRRQHLGAVLLQNLFSNDLSRPKHNRMKGMLDASAECCRQGDDGSDIFGSLVGN